MSAFKEEPNVAGYTESLACIQILAYIAEVLAVNIKSVQIIPPLPTLAQNIS